MREKMKKIKVVILMSFLLVAFSIPSFAQKEATTAPTDDQTTQQATTSSPAPSGTIAPVKELPAAVIVGTTWHPDYSPLTPPPLNDTIIQVICIDKGGEVLSRNVIPSAFNTTLSLAVNTTDRSAHVVSVESTGYSAPVTVTYRRFSGVDCSLQNTTSLPVNSTPSFLLTTVKADIAVDPTTNIIYILVAKYLVSTITTYTLNDFILDASLIVITPTTTNAIPIFQGGGMPVNWPKWEPTLALNNGVPSFIIHVGIDPVTFAMPHLEEYRVDLSTILPLVTNQSVSGPMINTFESKAALIYNVNSISDRAILALVDNSLSSPLIPLNILTKDNFSPLWINEMVPSFLQNALNVDLSSLSVTGATNKALFLAAKTGSLSGGSTNLTWATSQYDGGATWVGGVIYTPSLNRIIGADVDLPEEITQNSELIPVLFAEGDPASPVSLVTFNPNLKFVDMLTSSIHNVSLIHNNISPNVLRDAQIEIFK